MATRPLPTVIATLLLGVGLSPVSAQERTAERGWIGVSVELLTTLDRVRGTSVVTVTDVSEGSPAARAGIRPGDVLVSLNGRPGSTLVSLAAVGNGTERGLEIHPGDDVHVVLERSGARREVRLRAANRPEAHRVAATWSVRIREDSVADRMFRAMDSLRLRLVQGGGVVVGRIGEGAAAPGATPRQRVTWEDAIELQAGGHPVGVTASVRFPEARAPFTLLLLEGGTRDSLRLEIESLNGQIRTLRERHAVRSRQLEAGGRAADPGRDPELIRLESALTELRGRSEELQESIAMAARAEFGERFGQGIVTPGEEPAGILHARPLAPYVLGQNRAAGMEVVDLRPELADYFRVGGGVLVVDVAEGTPAALAEVLPGDVVTHVNAEPVGSISQLRLGLARSGTDAVLDIVRKGRSLKVRLPR